MSETRVLDDTPVLLRHIRRPQGAETGVSVLVGTFVAAGGAELDAINGRSGWQSGQVESALAGDGTVTLRLPNAQGDDGVLHRKRFALLTDPLYRIGEEWIEVYREPMSPENLLAVMTPAGARINRGELELRGPDLMGLYTLARSSELDIWHHAPRDVFEFYSRLPVAELAEPFPNTVVNAASPIVRSLPAGVAGTAWKASARLRWTGPLPPTATTQTISLEVRLTGGLILKATYRPFDTTSYFEGTGFGNISGSLALCGKANRVLPGDISITVLLRERWAYMFVAGELVATGQVDAAARYLAPDRVQVIAAGTATAELARLDVESSRSFGLRGSSKGDLKLPAVPPSGGLRATFYNGMHQFANFSTNPGGTWANALQAILDPLLEPVAELLAPTLTFTGSPAAAGGAPMVRWTGAIFLDLSGNGRRLRVTGGSTIAFRLWVGKTRLVTDAVIDSWTGVAKTDVRTANLRDVLGEGSGWYPIVIEAATLSGITFQFEETALDGAGAPTGSWTTVPASKLSPLGCYMETHRLESHRELLGAIAEAFGLQWRVDPKTLESGEFPGQVIPRARVGVDTDKIITAPESTDLQAEVDAMDAVDRLQIDAAGIADPKGSGQLTADAVNDVAIAAGHLFLSTGAESLPEITEAELLEQRADSLLALRATPNEQIGVRPTSLPNEVTDLFPLAGALARRRWRVGDGARLALEDLSVVDSTPRQFNAIALPIFRQGIGAPVVGFRQRPRGLRAFLQRTARAGAASRRNYQGQTAKLYGNLGANPTGAVLTDSVSRLTLPMNIEDVIDLYLVVEGTVAGTGIVIFVNGSTTGVPVVGPGRYPLLRHIVREAAITGPNRVIANIQGTGVNATYRLEATILLRS